MRRPLVAGRLPRAARHLLRTTCHVIRLRDNRVVADSLEDFSAAGLLVGPADPVLTGEQVLVLLRFPDTDDWLDVNGVVARVVHGRRPGEWWRRLGIDLEGLDARTRALVASNLARRPPAPPRARPGRRHWSPASVARLMSDVLA